MQIIVLPGNQMVNLNLDQPHAIISINDDENSEWPLCINSLCKGYERFYFHDIDVVQDGLTLFSEFQADDIVSFVNNIKQYVSTIVVHCTMGRSRSPAVAAAISYYLNGKGSEQIFFDHYTPNRKVFSTLLNGFMMQ